MAILSLRVFGLLLLTLTIGVSSCQALFVGGADDSRRFAGMMGRAVEPVAGAVRSPGREPKCSSCPSAAAHGHPEQKFPLTLVRPADRR